MELVARTTRRRLILGLFIGVLVIAVALAAIRSNSLGLFQTSSSFSHLSSVESSSSSLLYVTTKIDNPVVSADSFNDHMVITNPNDFPLSYLPELTVTMFSDKGNLVYFRVIEFNTTAPLEFPAHSSKSVYDGTVALAPGVEKGQYWLTVVGTPKGNIVVLTEPALVTLT